MILLRGPILAVLAVMLMAVFGASVAFAEATYTVAPGDTLWAISVRFDTTVDQLVSANDIGNANLIRVGQRLVIPGTGDGVPEAKPATAGRTPSTALPEPKSTRKPSAAASGSGSILAAKRLVTYYGHPSTGLMGVLGRYDPPTVIAKLQQQSAEYAALSDRPVQGALQLIAIVAQAGAGADGMYRARVSQSMIEEWMRYAEENNMLLILDLQPGRSDVLTEVEAMWKYMDKPFVHLALDPEFTMGPNRTPGIAIGSMDASTINAVQARLSALVAEKGLPNKILIVHQFLESMITNKEAIQADPNVDLVIDMDGFGGQAAKLSKYDYFNSPPVEYAGIKLFYREDTNLLSPDQLMALDPVPDVIIYQ